MSRMTENSTIYMVSLHLIIWDQIWSESKHVDMSTLISGNLCHSDFFDRERNPVFFKHSGIIRVGTWLWYSLERFLKCYHRLLKSKGWMNWVINWFLSFTSTSAQVCLLSTSTQTKIRGNQRAVVHCYEEPPCAKAAVEWFEGECRFAILLWVVMEALWYPLDKNQ